MLQYRLWYLIKVVNAWNSLPNCVVAARGLLSFHRQFAKFDLSSFFVLTFNFYLLLYILFSYYYCDHCFVHAF